MCCKLGEVQASRHRNAVGTVGHVSGVVRTPNVRLGERTLCQALLCRKRQNTLRLKQTLCEDLQRPRLHSSSSVLVVYAVCAHVAHLHANMYGAAGEA
jgi:hypothetical protein